MQGDSNWLLDTVVRVFPYLEGGFAVVGVLAVCCVGILWMENRRNQ